MTVLEGITLAIALVGAILGVITTWITVNNTRVKLMVRPKVVVPGGSADPRIRVCIEVSNLSAFAVTVDEVGFFMHGTERRLAFVRPVLADGGPWPRRLEPRSAVTVYAQQPEAQSRIRSGYARTQCGVVRRGITPALKQIADLAQQTSQ